MFRGRYKMICTSRLLWIIQMVSKSIGKKFVAPQISVGRISSGLKISGFNIWRFGINPQDQDIAIADRAAGKAGG
jgi:hypothetical protein